MIKGTLCSSGEEARNMAGSATYKQSKTFGRLGSVCLFSLFSHENKDGLVTKFLQVCSTDQNFFPQKLHSAPLMLCKPKSCEISIKASWICFLI